MKRGNSITFVIALAAANLNPILLRADTQVGIAFNQSIQLNATVNETDCDNSPGPYVTLEGSIILGGLQLEVMFANNVKGTHTTTVTTSNIVLIALGTPITIPKQPVLGGVGGNPFIWVQLVDNNGNNLTDPVFAGRCVQGLNINNSLLNAALAALVVTASDCNNNPGPYITFGGGLSLSGMKARFIFSNNVNGPHNATATVEVTIIPNNMVIKIPKQPVLGGSGGNPLIWIQLEQGDGTAIGSPQFIGRCNQI